MKKIIKFIKSLTIEFYLFWFYHILFLTLLPSSSIYLLMLVPHLIVLIAAARFKRNNSFITKIIFVYNHIVFGNKGKGKDLLYQLAVIKKFKKEHKKNPNKINYLSNVDYGYGYSHIKIKDLELVAKIDDKIYSNTYKEFIDDTLTKVAKIDKYEGLPLLISDGGIIFPSNEDVYLMKRYPTFPVFFALSRQLLDMMIGINTQALNRIWIKLREQQEAYIRCNHTTPLYKSALQKIWPYIPFLRKYYFINVTYYEKYESAEQGLRPFSTLGMLDHMGEKLKTSVAMAMKKQYESEHGVIKEFTCLVKLADVKYDTRIFHDKLYGITYAEWRKQQLNALLKS